MFNMQHNALNLIFCTGPEGLNDAWHFEKVNATLYSRKNTWFSPVFSDSFNVWLDSHSLKASTVLRLFYRQQSSGVWLIELLTIRGGAALQQGGVFFAVFRGGAALLRSRSPTLINVVRFVGQAIRPCQCWMVRYLSLSRDACVWN